MAFVHESGVTQNACRHGGLMIRVTRLDGSEFYVNAEFIQTVESSPDTHIALLNGNSYVVTEPDHEIVEQILSYRRSVYGVGGAAGSVAAHLKVVND